MKHLQHLYYTVATEEINSLTIRESKLAEEIEQLTSRESQMGPEIESTKIRES